MTAVEKFMCCFIASTVHLIMLWKHKINFSKHSHAGAKKEGTRSSDALCS